MSNNLKLLLIGSGYMTREYLKVIDFYNHECTVVGRGQENIDKLSQEFPRVTFHAGGIDDFALYNDLKIYTHCINLVNACYTYDVTLTLIMNGATNILLEKPGSTNIDKLKTLQKRAKNQAVIFIGYNRRFYASIQQLKALVKQEGGIESAHFEFTEWVHKISKDDYDHETLEKWVIANSSHVIDTVFYLIGLPKKINCYVNGKNTIDWHKTGSVFTGSGMSEKGVCFSYNSNWNSSGRWSIEISTAENRYILCPLEELRVQKKGEITVNQMKLNCQNEAAKEFKPGIHDLFQSFIQNNGSSLLKISDQIKNLHYLNAIGGYE